MIDIPIPVNSLDYLDLIFIDNVLFVIYVLINGLNIVNRPLRNIVYIQLFHFHFIMCVSNGLG